MTGQLDAGLGRLLYRATHGGQKKQEVNSLLGQNGPEQDELQSFEESKMAVTKAR